MKINIYSAVFLSLFFIQCNSVNEIVISKKGKANAVIVISETASDLEHQAAGDLRYYLKNIGEVQLEISETTSQNLVNIFIQPNEKLNKHTISYSVNKGNVLIEGGSPQSTLNATYVFLEREFGVRFYSPKVEKIPTQDDISIKGNLKYEYTPPITTRTVHSRLFYRENGHFAKKLRVTNEAFPTYVPIARVHTFHRFMPADKFYQSHPEYYALRNGKRLPTQLCLTNEKVFEIVRDSVASQLNRFPNAEVISVSQDDNTQYCQCDKCEAIHQREGSPSGTMIDFVNRIADEFPDKQISTLAYQYTRKAPKNLKPKENVLITLCSIECDRSAPINEKCQDFTNDLEEWSKISDNIRIWDYTTQFTNFLAPFPNIHTLKPNIELFRNNNAKWIFEQHSNQPSELFALRSYLTAQLLWNPEVDANAIIDDFLEGYYEEAAPFVKKYIDKVHNELQADSSFFLFLYGDPSQGFESFLNGDLLKTYDKWYNEAAVAVTDKPDVLKRVNEARLSIDYAMLEFAKLNLNEAVKTANITERLARFEATTKAGNITAMNEMRFTVAEYIDSYKKSIERAKNKNIAYEKKVELLTKPKKYAKEDPQTLTDGAFGGSSFYANWLGFEGNDLEGVIDLEEEKEIHQMSTAFLQVINHIVFFPTSVEFLYSLDGKNYKTFDKLQNQRPLTKQSKINDIQYFRTKRKTIRARYIKIIGQSMKKAPVWHHGAGLPSWIFIDEVMVE
jgi:hypothetical protein